MQNFLKGIIAKVFRRKVNECRPKMIKGHLMDYSASIYETRGGDMIYRRGSIFPIDTVKRGLR